MFLPRFFVERMMILLGSDTVWFGNATDGQLLKLASAPFNPAAVLVPADLTEAIFDGYSPIETAAGVKPESVDPLNGDVLLEIPAGATPFRWETDSAPSPAVTIYGWFLVSPDGVRLMGSDTFSAPYILNAANQSVTVNTPRVRLNPACVS